MLVYTGDKLDQIKEALIKFQQNKDTKAAMWMILYYMSQQVCSASSWATLLLVRTDATNTQTKIVAYYCYDAPTLPPGVFDDFMAIQPAQGNVTTRSYSDLILSLGANTNGTRFVVRYHRHVHPNFTKLTRPGYLTPSAISSTALPSFSIPQPSSTPL